MLSKSVARRLGRLRQPGLVRMQSTVASRPSESEPPQSPPASVQNGARQQPPTSAASAPPKKAAGKKRTVNRKLAEISMQVKKSVDAAEPQALAEAVEILEEGVSYLREIQTAEAIPDNVFFSMFQSTCARLMDKATAPGADLGARTVESLLELLVEHRIAHAYHFLAVQRALLQNASDADAYSAVLQWWIRYLEYSRAAGSAEMASTLQGMYGVYRERNFNVNDMRNLAYFALITTCSRTGAEYDINTTMKLLQVDDPARIPDVGHVASTLNRLNMSAALKDDMAAFRSKAGDFNLQHMDPNGAVVGRRIDTAARAKNGRQLRALYDEVRAASARNAIAVSEATLGRLMYAFVQAHLFQDALAIFSSMLGGLVPKPAASSWEMALRAMGHPSFLAGMSRSEKAAMLENVQGTFRTMIASGVPPTAKSFGVFIGCLANMDRMDLVGEYLAEFKHIPVVHVTRNNILVGLAVNGKLAEAESTMKRFLEEDPSYRPSTSVMNTFLAHHAAAENSAAVEGIINFMKTNGIEENIATTTTILNYYFKTFRRMGQIPDVRELFSGMAQNIAKWDQNMVATLLDGLAKDGVNMDAARAVYQYFAERQTRFKQSSGILTSMIKAELEFGSLHNAEELFDYHIKNVGNDTRMWNMMIAGLLAKNPSLAAEYYRKLVAQKPFNVAPNFYTYYFLLDTFTKKGDDAKIQWVLDEIAAANLPELGAALPKQIRRLQNRFKVDPQLTARVASA